jgi:hypothetical protein
LFQPILKRILSRILLGKAFEFIVAYLFDIGDVFFVIDILDIGHIVVATLDTVTIPFDEIEVLFALGYREFANIS